MLKFIARQERNVRSPTRPYLGHLWPAKSQRFSARNSKLRRSEKLKRPLTLAMDEKCFFDKVVIDFSMMQPKSVDRDHVNLLDNFLEREPRRRSKLKSMNKQSKSISVEWSI